MSEWISVDESAPEEITRVVVWCRDPIGAWLDVGSTYEGYWSDAYGKDLPVTHWKRQEPPCEP